MLTASLITGLALKSLALAGVTLGLLRLASKRTPAERSLIAHFGLLAIVLLPLASLALPEWAPLPQHLFAGETAPAPIPGPMAPAATLPAVADIAAPAAASLALPAPAQIAVWVYAIPLALMFAMMALAVLRLFGMRRRAEVLVDGAWLSALAGAQRRMGFKHGTALLVSEELRSPISWGVLRPTILLDPRAVSAVGDAEAIIAHELAHVARLDWAKLLIARLACALFWFNPLVWILARESHQLREEAADDTVLLTDIAGSDYATLLVNAARHDNSGVLIAAHGVAPAKNSLHRRVVRVLDADVRRAPARGGWSALSLATVLVVAAPLAAFTTVATRPAPGIESANTSSVTEHVAERTAGERAGRSSRPLTPDDLVTMRALNVQPADLAQSRDGAGRIDPDQVIAAKATGATPEYMADIRSVFPNADSGELIGARAVGVDAGYARQMRAIDPRADLDMVIGARAVGVTPAYARQIGAFFPGISLDDLVSMRATGVTAADIRMMREAGMDVGSADDVAGAKAIMGPRGPQVRAPRPVGTVRAVRDGAVAITGPNGTYASRREADGTISSVSAVPPPVPEPDAD